MKKGFCFRVIIFVTLLLLGLGAGSSAYAEKKFIKGEARFYSQDEDPLNFVKSQLLEKSFRDVITKEMNRLGFNGESFWRTFWRWIIIQINHYDGCLGDRGRSQGALLPYGSIIDQLNFVK